LISWKRAHLDERQQFDVSISSAIRWLQHFGNDGRSEPMPSGGSISFLEKHAQGIFTLIAEQPDLTLDEMVRVLRKLRILASPSALSCFFARHNITVKKRPHSRGAQARRRGSGAATLDARARVA
jgi:transposase